MYRRTSSPPVVCVWPGRIARSDVCDERVVLEFTFVAKGFPALDVTAAGAGMCSGRLSVPFRESGSIMYCTYTPITDSDEVCLYNGKLCLMITIYAPSMGITDLPSVGQIVI